MFRSTAFALAAFASQFFASQPAAHAGEFRPISPQPHFSVSVIPQINLPHFPVPQPHVPRPNVPVLRDPRFKHFETYLKWQSNHRLLGDPVGRETSVFSSRSHGSWMRFEHGYIVRHASGRAFIVRGGIGRAWIENGGVYGKLGMPKGNEFEFSSHGHDAQVFQYGVIYWNASLGRFVVGPNKSKF